MDWVEMLLKKSCDKTLTKKEVLHSLFHMIEVNENTLNQIKSDKRDFGPELEELKQTEIKDIDFSTVDDDATAEEDIPTLFEEDTSSTKVVASPKDLFEGGEDDPEFEAIVPEDGLVTLTLSQEQAMAFLSLTQEKKVRLQKELSDLVNGL